MGNEYIILEGKDYDRLIAEAMQRLNVKKEDLKVEVLESKKNLFSSYYKLKVSCGDLKSLESIESSIDNILVENQRAREKNIEFSFREDGVYVKIDSRVTIVDIVTKIDLKRIQSVDLTKIKQLLEIGSYDNWTKIAEPQEEKKIDSECIVKLSKDNMKAYVTLTRPIGGADVTEKIIQEALMLNHVVFNIKEEEVRNAVINKKYDNEILVAEGIEPQDGQDARIDYHFDVSAEKSVNIDKDGKIDYHELSLITNVKRGQKLVTLIPHTQGIPGKNVLGNDVPGRDGKKLALPRGKNVDASEDGLELIAAVDGEVKILDGKVNVFSVYEVKHNVDNSTGNIRFNGKVIVMGNVLTGFVIEAEGDVEVYGVVEGALIRSNGSIILHRGIQGMNRGELYCEGDLIAKFIENSKIEAKGNVQSDAIMHSQVTCGKKLEANGRKGLLVGGSFKVGEEIRAKVIGSPMATITELEVGVNPDLRKKYEDIKNELKQINENLDRTTKAVDLLTKMSKTVELPMDKKLLLTKSVKLKLQLQQNQEQIKNEQNEMEAYFEELSRGKVRVYDIIYPGSRIIIGSSMMHIKDSVKYVTFYRANAEIKMGSYDDI
ncbi:MAG TPA: FapA family protein [Clostridia bacterium]|nr:FapA family protein [Clostridia bacterium]